MLNTPHPLPTSHKAFIDQYRAAYDAGIQNGDFEPYVWPYRSFGPYVLLAYMLLPPTKNKLIIYLKFPVFAFFAYECTRTIFETKSASIPLSYGIGLVDAWAVIWCGSLVIFGDHREAQRVERQTVEVDERNSEMEAPHLEDNKDDGSKNTATASTSSRFDEKSKLQERSHPTIDPPKCNNSSNTPSAKTMKPFRNPTYYWQSLPPTFLARLDFILDLLFSMRGPGWSHQARCVPSPPSHISSSLSPTPPSTRPTSRTYTTLHSLYKTNILRFLMHYLLLDLLKTYTTHDLYFLNNGSLLSFPLLHSTPQPPPPFFLPHLLINPVTLKSFRLLIALFTLRSSLALIFTLSPLFFSLMLPHIHPSFSTLRTQPWYYPDFEGHFSHLTSSGLAGFWGGWWHQIFRLGFSAPSSFIIEHMYWDPKNKPSDRQKAKLVSVLVAFTCSALVHAAGSRSMLSLPSKPTKPLAGPGAFFVLQALGVISEGVAKGWLERKEWWRKGVPDWVKGMGNLGWVGVWMYFTAPLLVDDLVRGGIWGFEPVPVSFLRSAVVGWGGVGDDRGAWRWWGGNLGIWMGKDGRWWRGGIAV